MAGTKESLGHYDFEIQLNKWWRFLDKVSRLGNNSHWFSAPYSGSKFWFNLPFSWKIPHVYSWGVPSAYLLLVELWGSKGLFSFCIISIPVKCSTIDLDPLLLLSLLVQSGNVSTHIVKKEKFMSLLWIWLGSTPLDESHTYKHLSDKHFRNLGFWWDGWRTMPLTFLDALSFYWESVWDIPLISLEDLLSYRIILRYTTLNLSETWTKDFIVTLGFIFGRFTSSALDLIFAQKLYLNFSIVCHLERLRIFKPRNFCLLFV